MTYKSDELNETKDAQGNLNSGNDVNEFIDNLIADCLDIQGCTAPPPDTTPEKPQKDNWSNIIDNLVEIRQSKGMTQSELAQACGIKRSVLTNFENKKHAPQLDTLVKIAAALGYKITINHVDKYTAK